MRIRPVLPLVTAAAALALAGPALTAVEATTTPNPIAYFAANSAWNTPIPPAPAIDPDSERWVSAIKDGAHVANIGDYGVPVYDSGATDRRFKVPLRYSPAWGPNPFATDRAPLRWTYRPSSGTDSAMVVIRDGKTYEFWQYRWRQGDPIASWGAVLDVNGDGRCRCAPTGAGVSRLAGVVTAEEFEAGVIPHALVFSTNYSGSGVRYPATKSDGSNGAGAIPEGARFQLDPTFDVSTISDPKERMVAIALQPNGANNIDNGGAPMALIFETVLGAPSPYAAAGWSPNYHPLNSIPWDRLRVLRQWDGL